jgi:hypothetical protein
MAGSVFSTAISFVRIKISNCVFFTDWPSDILVRARGLIAFYQPPYFLFAREKLRIPFMEIEGEYADTQA